MIWKERVMASITFKHVKKIYPGNVTVVPDLNLEIKDKEFVILVGPSGCGKSTTLRMIAGLEDVSEGELYIGDRVVNDVAPKDRDIAMVFQNYALYPHMTVYKNIAFGLNLKKMPKDEIDRRVHEAAKALDLEHLLNRKPKALSGGQRQRVALGRAMVRDPAVFLLDEPLSNLDAKLRTAMRSEISRLHKRLQTTFVYVTHDQTEAMTMGDRIVVMKDGIIQQMDTPQNLYDFPCNLFVAGFIGSPQMNFYRINLNGNVLQFEDGCKLELPDTIAEKLAAHKNGLIMGIRGEDIKFDAPNLDLYAATKQKAVIDNTEIMGNENNLYFEFGGITSVARVSKYEVSKIGDTVEFVMMPHKMHFFDLETEKAIVL